MRTDRPLAEIILDVPGFDPYRSPGDATFVEARAAHKVDFIEQCCSHILGPCAGQRFLLEDWQKAIVANIYGWIKPNGARRFREALIYVPRKNGKSPLCACFILAGLFADNEPGARIFGAAAEYSQAAIVFDYARGMVLQEPELQRRCKIYNGQAKSIQMLQGFNTYRVVSGEDKSKHGYQASMWALDELHVQANRLLYDALGTGTSARTQPLGISLTTADYDHDSICNEVHGYATKIRDGIIDVPSFLPAIWEATEEDDPFDPATWWASNPNLGVSKMLEYMEATAAKAKCTPSFLNTFKRLDLNVKTVSDVRWITPEMWARGAVASFDEEMMQGRSWYGGLDLASTQDITALVLVSADGNANYTLDPYFWVPQGLADKMERDGKPLYQTWIREGFMRATPGGETDFGYVRRDINKIAETRRIFHINADRLFQGVQLSQQLKGDGFNVAKFGQGFYDFAAPCLYFETQLLAGQIHHDGNPVLAWMASNISVEIDAAGSRKPNKITSGGKIDGIVCAIMGLSEAMKNDVELDSGGFIFV